LVGATTTVLDFGCGHGDDVKHLVARGVPARGWDPTLRPDVELRPAQVVNLGYVLNVIEDVRERTATLQRAWALAEAVLVVAVRTVHEQRDLLGERLADGLVTKRGTFQKFFEPAEAMGLISTALGKPAVAVTPGIFYVFRSETAQEAFAASRIRRRAPVRARLAAGEEFERHRRLLSPIVDFLDVRGRLPSEVEVPMAGELVQQLGSFARARRIVVQALGADYVEQAEVARTEDLLVYLALTRFQRRPRFSVLPIDFQQDVRSLFRSYERACVLADEVLLSVGQREPLEKAFRTSNVGKLTPSALYVHVSALQQLPPLLRIYEGCARAYVGCVEGANIVKLHRDNPAVSYLLYPRFDSDAHPSLVASLLVGLRTLRVEHRRYEAAANPPILHRKETMVDKDYPRRGMFSRLTKAEEKAGLFAAGRTIGTRQVWEEALRENGLRLRGHRLLRLS